MESDYDEYYNGEKVYKKPSLQSRLQSGMNLQICFMNENVSDNESITSDPEVENNSFENSGNFIDEKHQFTRPDSLIIKV